MKKTYKAGIIGLGFIGGADQVSGDALGQRVENLDGTHLVALANNARVEVAGGSSRDEGRRERFINRIEGAAAGIISRSHTTVSTHADWRELIATHNLDIVSVATYTPTHAEITVACAQAGIPVIYCEKPIAPTIGEALRMVDACRASGSLLVINHNRRFNPDFRRLRSVIADGVFGKITSVTTRWGAGRLGNVGTHIFDAVLMITGGKPVAVSGTLDETGRPDCRGAEFSDPGGWGLIRLDTGCMVTVDAADYAACPLTIEVNGTEGRARIIGLDMTVTTGNSTESWTRDTSRSSMDIAVDDIVTWLDERESRRSQTQTTGIGSTPDFAYDPADAVRTLETIVAFHASHRHGGGWIDLPLAGVDRDIVLHSG